MIITISREYGAGGSAVARRVADALGWRVVDNELIDRVATRAGLPPWLRTSILAATVLFSSVTSGVVT